MTDRLPELLDCKALRAELGVTRAAAEALMRNLPVVEIEGLRKVYVRRDHVLRYLEERTSEGHWRFEKTGAPILTKCLPT